MVSVEDGPAITGNSGTLHAFAHSILASTPVSGDDKDYCLLPPDLRKQDTERAKQVDSDWQDHCGEGSLGDLPARSRSDRGSGYAPPYGDGRGLRANGRAFSPGELPPPGRPANLACRHVSRPR